MERSRVLSATHSFDVQHINDIHDGDNILTISTGSSDLDGLLGGGICCGEITEVFGDHGSGKTQLALSLCKTAACIYGSALIIDADGSVSPQRLYEMGIDGNSVHIWRLVNANQILACVPFAMPKLLEDIGNVRVVILDSISFIARTSTLEHPLSRIQILIDRLGHIATSCNCAVVVINDTKAADDKAVVPVMPYPVPTASMGSSWASACPVRLALAKTASSERYAVLVDHPRQVTGHALFEIDKCGIRNYR